MKLIEIGETGELAEELDVDDFLREVVEASVAHYQRTGFMRPWIGYVGLEGEVTVGVCGFKGQPVGGRVEIAYGTAPGQEGKGVATELARELVGIAREKDASLAVVAQTLPNENASTRILTKLGFQRKRTVDHPEDGLVWEWELAADVPVPGSELA